MNGQFVTCNHCWLIHVVIPRWYHYVCDCGHALKNQGNWTENAILKEFKKIDLHSIFLKKAHFIDARDYDEKGLMCA